MLRIEIGFSGVLEVIQRIGNPTFAAEAKNWRNSCNMNGGSRPNGRRKRSAGGN
jgi:hypothetical protein